MNSSTLGCILLMAAACAPSAATVPPAAPPSPAMPLPAAGSVPSATALPAAQPRFPAGTRFLRIIATNDFHGALEPRLDANGVRRGGAAYVAAAIDRARAECTPRCETLLLDAGDLCQGTLSSSLRSGRLAIVYYILIAYAPNSL